MQRLNWMLTKTWSDFYLANHNPRSTNLKTILSDPEIDKYAQSQLFDLKFYVASFAGYGLHAKCMLPLVEFLEVVIECNLVRFGLRMIDKHYTI